MQYRVNPRNGDRISALGLGCMRFPGPPGRPDSQQARAIIARAVERGISLDTAYLSGQRGLRGRRARRPGPARPRPYRHQAAARLRPHHRGPRPHLRRAAPPPAHGPYRLLSDAQRHEPRPVGAPARPGHRAGSPASAAGRIRQSASPTTAAPATSPALLDAYDWDFCRSSTTTRARTVPGGHHWACAPRPGATSPSLIMMEPLLGGPPRRQAARPRPPHPRRHGHARLVTPAAWGLSWVWDHPEVTMLLSGMAAPEQVDENAAVACRALPGSLTQNSTRSSPAWSRSSREPTASPCGCNYCMPCPQGINIPGCFSAYNASFAHGWFTGLSQYFTASAVRRPTPSS